MSTQLTLGPGELPLLIASCDYFTAKERFALHPELRRILSDRLCLSLPREPELFAASFIGLRDYLQQNAARNPLPLPFKEDPVWLYHALIHSVAGGLALNPCQAPAYSGLLEKLKGLFPHDSDIKFSDSTDS